MIGHRNILISYITAALFLSCGWAKGATPATQPSGDQDLTGLSLEDLMSVQVTSVSKAPQKISDAPAAVTVIGQDDIHRSGMDRIPDLLRLAPGMDVAQVDASHWAISSRGMNNIFADDLLVLMDGRSLYTPVFGGVTWDTVDYPLEDLDRIEVIRGPGSTLWGSNAVNGVVNIITKSAKDTQGALFDGRLGTSRSDGTAQYGGQIDPETYYRVYGKYQYTDSNDTAQGNPAHDEWQSSQSGFRVDRYSDAKDQLTLQGDVYEEQFHYVTSPPPLGGAFTGYDSGGNILGRWTHTESEQADSSLQLYYDHEQRSNLPASYDQDQFDAQFQSRAPLGDRQEVTWGLGARDTISRFSSPVVGADVFNPRRKAEYLVNGFVQDQITLVPDKVQWYVGTKLEYNNITDFEVQPGTRLLWTPDQNNSVWAAVSRSVRIPSIYQDTNINLGGFQINTLNPDSEKTLSYELGYKVQPAKTVTMDVTGFYNDYRDLINLVPTSPFPPTVAYGNLLAGQTYGTEFSANWQVTPAWRIAGSYTFLKVQAQVQPGALAGFVPPSEIQFMRSNSPQQQFQLHSYLDITRDVQFNASAYVASQLAMVRDFSGNTQRVPGYLRLDLNVSWQINPNAQLTVGVQNLTQRRHSEFGNINTEVVASQVPRSVYAECELKY